MEKITLNLDSLATLLYCLDLQTYKEVPLNQDEWWQVKKIMKQHGLKGPASLLGLESDELLDILEIPEFIVYKMIKRQKAMPIFLSRLSELESKGISVMSEYDDCYPDVLHKTMKKRAPICLYYAGAIDQFDEGVSICGLNELEKKDSAYTKRIVDKIIKENKYYISNDVKGVDYSALIYALNHNCQVVCFVCHNMMEKLVRFRKYIKSKQLILLSAVDPTSRFDVTHAIDRNSYVCGLSKYQVIVSCKINNGATWFTALQNMHHHWVEPLVLDNKYIGNQRLLEMQATPLYIKDVLSDLSFEMIYLQNQKHIEVDEVSIDQMSIFEFIGDSYEQ